MENLHTNTHIRSLHTADMQNQLIIIASFFSDEFFSLTSAQKAYTSKQGKLPPRRKTRKARETLH